MEGPPPPEGGPPLECCPLPLSSKRNRSAVRGLSVSGGAAAPAAADACVAPRRPPAMLGFRRGFWVFWLFQGFDEPILG